MVGEPKVNGIGVVPIVEYRADEQRMGCFEKVLDLLDALGVLTSDRVNGLSQFVSSILWADNVQLDKDQKEDVKKWRLVVYKSDSYDESQYRVYHSTTRPNERTVACRLDI